MNNKIIKYFTDNKKVIKIVIFLIYIVLNLYFVIRHEPWRDEAHAWLMAKNLNIIELFKVSRFDGHPILWHLILMPFAKIGFPYITLQIINLLICVIAAYIFYFKIELNELFKTIILFGTPFIYVYTTIARNYGLILLFCMLIAYLYKDRYKHPYKYILLLCLLLNTPTLAWGLAISLFVFFEVEAIYKQKKENGVINKKNIVITTCIFIACLSFVCFELYGTSNPDYPKPFSYPIIFIDYKFVYSLILFSLAFFIVSIIINKKMIKEFFIFFIAILVQVFIILFFYPSVFEIRFHYQCIIWLSFVLIVSNNYDSKYLKILPLFFIVLYFSATCDSYSLARMDIKYRYSNGKAVAEWINKNLDIKEILIEKAIFSQSIVPYLNNIEVYDIYYEKNFSDLKVYSDISEDKEFDLKKYNDKYIIVYSYDFYQKYKDYLVEIYKPDTNSLTGEYYEVFKINSIDKFG